MNKLQSVHMLNAFLVYLGILARKILASSLQLFFPAKIFSSTVSLEALKLQALQFATNL